MTLDPDICMHACLLAQSSSLFKLIEITTATVDSQVLRAMSAIRAGRNAAKRTIVRSIDWPRPLNDTANAHAFLDIAIFFIRCMTCISLLGASPC
jgi:hypothetical protein